MTKVMILYSEKLWKLQEDCRKKEEKKKKSKQTNKQEGQTSQVELELDKTEQME